MDEQIELENMPGGNSRSYKKKLRKHQDKRKQLYVAVFFVNCLYLITPFLFNEEPYDFPVYTFGLHALLSLIFSRLILNSILSGYDYEYYFDIFAINLAAQLFAIYTDKAYYLFLLPPGFAIYKLIRRIVTWVFTPTPEELQEAEMMKAKAKNVKQKGKRRRVNQKF